MVYFSIETTLLQLKQRKTLVCPVLRLRGILPRWRIDEPHFSHFRGASSACDGKLALDAAMEMDFPSV